MFGVFGCSARSGGNAYRLCFGVIDGVVFCMDIIILKVSKKGDKGFQICSVPMKKLRRMVYMRNRSWRLKGDFLVLEGE